MNTKMIIATSLVALALLSGCNKGEEAKAPEGTAAPAAAVVPAAVPAPVAAPAEAVAPAGAPAEAPAAAPAK